MTIDEYMIACDIAHLRNAQASIRMANSRSLTYRRNLLQLIDEMVQQLRDEIGELEGETD